MKQQEVMRFTHTGPEPLLVNNLLRQHHVSQRLRRHMRSDGQLFINGRTITWHTWVQPREELTIALPSEQQWEPYAYDLSILYEDEHLLVINKPAPMLMHPTASERYTTLANALVYYFESTQQLGHFHPVHRLDKNTSGAVIIAKNPFIQHAFQHQSQVMEKTYLAVVEGHVSVPYASLCNPIGRKEGSIIERCCTPTGKSARTDVTVLATYQQSGQNYTAVQCTLHTGRTHQIRVHLSHLGYPLVGDDLYGGHCTLSSRQALHAWKLTFIHPITGEIMHIKAPWPTDIETLLDKKYIAENRKSCYTKFGL